MTANGLGEKSREWDERDDRTASPAKKLRAFIAKTLNEQLKTEGKADIARVEHESFKDRGIGRKPTVHHGPANTHMLRKEQRLARTAWQARERREQRERHARERASLKLRQDFALQNKMAALDQRGREGRAALRRDFAQAAKADIPARGLRRAFLTATGQHVREEFNRQARTTQRTADAEQQKADLKATLKAERNAFVKSQVDEWQRLADRHKSEDRQLEQAFEHRKSLDRAAEVHARSNDTRSLSREQQRTNDNDREQGRGRSISRDDLTPP